ncbi:MAG TPA: nucleoside-diphosphate sugar epimerase/dehydratase [Candidatus Limnocylindria bacterium]|nr:nucleoside-diphosphate sugar epimerase/dehydratase [Candidatus Limnocylindria bacterium]
MPTRPNRTAYALFAFDVMAATIAPLASLFLRFDTADPTVWLLPFLPIALLPVFVQPAVYLVFGLYRREWRHASVRDLLDLVKAVAVGSMLILLIYGVLAVLRAPGTSPFPRSFFIVEPIFFLTMSAGVRLMIRATLERHAIRQHPADAPTPTIVYGAGSAGATIGRLVNSGGLPEIRIVGYVDDDPRKQRSRLMGTRVWGALSDLPWAVDQTGATQLLVAMPSGRSDPVRRAVAAAQDLQLSVKIVPPLPDLLTGRYQVSGIRSVSVEDLLRREPVEIDVEAIAASINGASIVVTGGGGSIGGELVRQILTLGPRVLTIVEYHEWTLWNIERDIAAQRRESGGTHVVASLADVRSPSALDAVIRRARPDVVFHAAALKHVPYVEMFPTEGVLTNVVGTRNVLRACEQFAVQRFVLISTDKAVEPVSVMGATKRLAEQLTVVAGRRTERAYAAVRFGNVLGSSGSVVPLLQRQLDDGLPLTITRPDATRYFMTIAEAVSLILEAGSSPDPGDIYVLDMGEPVRIIDLARDLVRLNRIDPDTVDFAVTGLRPGERLHEKLFYDDENAERTRHPGILRASSGAAGPGPNQIEALVDELAKAAREQDDQTIRELLGTSLLAAPDHEEAADSERWIRPPPVEA